MWVIKGNISDDDNAFLSIICLDGLRGSYREEYWAYIDELLCMSRWLNSSIKFDMLEEYGSTEGNIMVDYQSKMRLILENLLMICWQDAHNQSDSSWKNQRSRMIISNFFMIIKQHHTWGQGQAWWTTRVVISVDSLGWALHLRLSRRLIYERLGRASELQEKKN